METRVISYSLTGNNDALAEGLARELGARHIRVTENKPRTMWTIAADMLLNRTPAVSYMPEELHAGESVVFVAPVWMGAIASPMRECFRRLKKKIGGYYFVSISGGADGPNPKLAAELKRRLKQEPVAVIDMHIADLLQSEPRPTRDDTSAYRLTASDTGKLTREAASIINKECIK